MSSGQIKQFGKKIHPAQPILVHFELYAKIRGQTVCAIPVVHYSGEIVPMHKHLFYELVVVQKGDGVHCVDGVMHKMFPGYVFLLPPGICHNYRDFSSLMLLPIMFKKEALEAPGVGFESLSGLCKLFSGIGTTLNGYMMLDEMNILRVNNLVRQMIDEQTNRKEGCLFALSALFIEVMLIISRNLKVSADSNPTSLRMTQVLGYLDRHYASDISINEMADIAGMSLTNFRRCFKKELFVSPVNYLLKLRITHARELLENTSLSLAEVSEKCGFHDVNYFSRQFTRVSGFAPGTYRRKTHGKVHYPWLNLLEGNHILFRDMDTLQAPAPVLAQTVPSLQNHKERKKM